MRTDVSAVVLAVIVTACLPPAGTLFRTTLSNPDGSYELPVAVGDQTGLVVGIQAAEGDPTAASQLSVHADPNDPNAFIVTWVGGACDNDAALTFQSSGAGYTLNLEVHGKLSFGCPAVGILRGLRISTSEPVPAGSITASGPR